MRTKGLWILAGGTFLWGSAALLGASDGAGSIFEYLSYFYGGLLFGATTLAILVPVVIRGIRRGDRLRLILPLPLLLQSGFILLVVAAINFDLAFGVRFVLSRAALGEAAEEIRSARRAPRPGWIGLFHVREVNTVGSAVRFITGECFLDDCGLAFNREGEPPRDGEDSYVHLVGPWWRWHRSW
jgi:hypothetical protein